MLDALPLFGRALADRIRPPEPLPPSRWMAQNLVLVDGPLAGETWSGEGAPYLAEIADCLSDDHPANLVTVRKAQQTGASILALGWALYVADREPCNMLYGVPGKEALGDINGQKLQPLIEAAEKRMGRQIMVPQTSRSGTGSTTYEKKFMRGGYLALANANTVMDLSMKTVKKGVKDEYSKWQQLPTGQDPNTLFMGRFTAFRRTRNYKILEISTPEVDTGDELGEAPGHCRIDASFRRSDQRFWHVPCPGCGKPHVFAFEHLVIDRGKPEATAYRMPCCQHVMSEEERVLAVRRGRWVATKHEPDRHPGFHIDAFVSLMMSFRAIAEDFLAIKDEKDRKDFSNLVLALPHRYVEVAIEHEAVLEAARKAPYPRQVVPARAGFLTSAADVQGYGIKWSVWAHGPNSQRWLIDREVFEGAPDQSDEPWIKLADALQRTYPTAGGIEKGIDLSGVDSGFATNRVYRFCAGRPNCLALDGRSGAGLPWIGTPKKQIVRGQHGRIITKVMLYPVGAHDVKTEVMGGLANLVAGPDEVSGAWPRNVAFLCPELVDADFVKELTAERLVSPEEETALQPSRRRRTLVRSDQGRVWRKVFGRANDWLDAAVYAFALGWHLRVDRLTPAAWAERLLLVHGQAPAEPSLFEGADPFVKVKPQGPKRAGLDLAKLRKLNG